MSIADLPATLIATDNQGGEYDFEIAEHSGHLQVGIMWVKMQELIDHINDLEKKLEEKLDNSEN